MGAIQGFFQAQYEVLRANGTATFRLFTLYCIDSHNNYFTGHSPSEAFNETVEEATQSLYPLIGAKGMDWMYANCSATGMLACLLR